MNCNSIFIFILFFFSINCFNDYSLKDNFQEESTFCTTWSSSQYQTRTYNYPPIKFTNNSIRQIVHISASGEKVRVKFTNKFGASNLEILSANIADSVSQGSGEIDLNTLTPLTFDGKESVIIPPGADVYSDTFSYNLKALSEVAISTYFGTMPTQLTGHSHSQTCSFLEEGNKINIPKFSRDIRVTHWYVLSAVEVSSIPRKKAVICFGDSITDGHGSTNDIQGRWTDYFSEKLHSNPETAEIGVVNEGIRGQKVTTDGLSRYDDDVLNVKGATYIVVLFGVNDINSLNATFDQVTTAYKKLIKRAHRSNKFIYGATILPYGRNNPWTEEREKIRQQVNDWIRNTKPEDGGYDSCIDFDKVMKDPNEEKNLLIDYDSGDGIHPNSNGYKNMASAFDDLSLFTREPNFNIYDYLEKIEIIDKEGIKFKLDFYLEKNEEVTVRINGTTNGSIGFRILATNDEGVKTSNYYYSGKFSEGGFEYVVKLSVINTSNYIEIRRPISTINIDNIKLNFVEVETLNNKKLFSPGEEGILF